MGICASCCGGKRPKYADDEPFGRLSAPAPQTEADREARALAAERAEARQQQFERSAVGRAAIKSVKEAKRQDERPAGNNTARDWLS
ncbi:hypothetical protein OEZ86_002813 [Tetradesmus obliquus]|uniref:Uncharacterized protein n=2 Tax=Tetradesmus obliquus TaxID=3088 RepID=A0A383VFW3_TETOB|nr:hypothetical protein OEZ85_011915 [Tetradesmus obliquus]WIA31957.1 hypothetical protein OEZ86_002813 [Tetradesmus obliquus]